MNVLLTTKEGFDLMEFNDGEGNYYVWQKGIKNKFGDYDIVKESIEYDRIDAAIQNYFNFISEMKK